MLHGDAVPVDTHAGNRRLTVDADTGCLQTSPPGKSCRFQGRRGVLSLWTVFAMTLVGILTFTVIHLWLYADTLQRARHCCESAALAAGYAWLSDDMLRFGQQSFETDARTIRATEAALQIAEFYGGYPTIPRLREDDVQFQWPAPTTVVAGMALSPESIQVRFIDAQHTAAAGRPWGTSMASLDVAASVVLENQPIAFRPGPGQTVPMLPFALQDQPRRNADGTVAASGYWTQSIEEGAGADLVSWDAASHQFVTGPDGIPEITVTVSTTGNPDAQEQLIPLEFRQPAAANLLADDIARGLRLADLQTLGYSEVGFPTAFPVRSLNAAELLQADAVLQTLSGRAFVLCLCTPAAGPSPGPATSAPIISSTITLTRPVGVRLVDLQRSAPDQFQLRFQPCVLASALAVTGTDANTPRNRYIYSVRLSE